MTKKRSSARNNSENEIFRENLGLKSSKKSMEILDKPPGISKNRV